MKMRTMMLVFLGLMIRLAVVIRSALLFLIALFAISEIALAADLPTKAAPYAYPTMHCGAYYGVNSIGSTAAVNNAAVGTQFVQGAIGLTVGWTCPAGSVGYWFIDGMFDIANLNGSTNGLSLSGPAKFEQRFGFGVPMNMFIAAIPGLSTLQSAVPSISVLPTLGGATVVTSNPYAYISTNEDDIGASNGLTSFKQYLFSVGFGIGNKVRLSNGIVFDPFAEYVLPTSQVCFGAAVLCIKRGPEAKVGWALEF